MEIGPIFRALLRNKLGALLIALQIAFTMTVIINAVFIINERNRLMARPSGLDESNLFHITVIGFGDDYNEEIVAADDLAMLRQTPGIVDATVINAIPVSGGGSSTGVRLINDETSPSTGTAIYRLDEHGLNTLNLDLIAGENFTATDMRLRYESGPTEADKAVVTRALVESLFDGMAPADVLGEVMYMPGGDVVQIVGVVDRLQAPWPTSQLVERSMLVPENYIDSFSRYMIRTEPGQRDRMMAEVERMLVERGQDRVVRDMEAMEVTRANTYRVDSALTTILRVVVATLIVINCMGIVGLAVFSINRRKKQIGTRRALGATRPEILRYFLLENLFITIAGVALGAVLTIALSIVLTTNFNMPTMAWYYTPLGALLLILVGQLSALGPSARAAGTEPAIATRSV
ncbi:MAG: FtsX-like permease family protein [Pseudomonadales bacterium]|nr:FtsX-like permease family protein [Pseudomonadales bacterium]